MDKIKPIPPIPLDTFENLLEFHANEKTSVKVSNGGLPYAAILMGVMFKHCKGMARIYCQGFKPELVCELPFWTEFCAYIRNPKNRLYALVDSTEWINERPMKLLNQVKKERSITEHVIEYKRRKEGKGNKKVKKEKDIIIPDTSIIVKQIHPDSAKMIAKRYGESIHFSVFDNEKFRYEYNSENYKAYGSFNQPDNCKYLIETFDQIFNDPASKIII